MDRSQIFIWMISLCFSVAPFWGVSEIEAEAEAVMAEAVDSLETAFDVLDEGVQNELVFKRLMIEAIDQSMEINEALGFEGTGTMGRVLVVPAWWLTFRFVWGGTGAVKSEVRRVTHNKRMVSTEAQKQLRGLVRDLFNKESSLKTAHSKLDKLQSQATVEKLRVAEANATSTAKAEEGKIAGDAEKTAQATKEGKIAGDAEKTAQATKEGKIAGDAEKTAQSRKQVSVNTQTTSKLIAKQENIVKTLETEVSELKTNITRNTNLKLGKIWYRLGRFARGVGLSVVMLASITAQAVIVGDTVIIVFDFAEDMEDLREQYIQDIEEVVDSAAESAS